MLHTSTAEQPVSPVREQIADVDKNRRRRGGVLVLATTRWIDGDRGPAAGARLEDLETGLATQSEQKSDRPVVRVRTRAHVIGVRLGCPAGRWVV